MVCFTTNETVENMIRNVKGNKSKYITEIIMNSTKILPDVVYVMHALDRGDIPLAEAKEFAQRLTDIVKRIENE